MAVTMTSDMITGRAPLTLELEALAKRLRLSTVQVQRSRHGGGSGVIWRSTGLIVTSAHVVRGKSAKVTLADGRVFEAIVTSRDPAYDLAVLHLDARDLPSISVGDSNALQVGELVFAVGNSRGIVGGLTAGIVHALDPHDADLGPKWVRADLSLPRGYSGGPLADAQGRVIGINSNIFEGLACAVPSKTVESFLINRRRSAVRSY
jgi:serine protease Do